MPQGSAAFHLLGNVFVIAFIRFDCMGLSLLLRMWGSSGCLLCDRIERRGRGGCWLCVWVNRGRSDCIGNFSHFCRKISIFFPAGASSVHFHSCINQQVLPRSKTGVCPLHRSPSSMNWMMSFSNLTVRGSRVGGALLVLSSNDVSSLL